jgi:hypothetical protein
MDLAIVAVVAVGAMVGTLVARTRWGALCGARYGLYLSLAALLLMTGRQLVYPGSSWGITDSAALPWSSGSQPMAELLQSAQRFPSARAISPSSKPDELLPGNYERTGEELYLFPDKSYLYLEWTDVFPISVCDRGTWRYQDGLVLLHTDETVCCRGPWDHTYLAFTAHIGKPPIPVHDRQDRVVLLGANGSSVSSWSYIKTEAIGEKEAKLIKKEQDLPIHCPVAFDRALWLKRLLNFTLPAAVIVAVLVVLHLVVPRRMFANPIVRDASHAAES